MYALFWDCPDITTPADAWPYAVEADVDTEAAWAAAYSEVFGTVPTDCKACEDVHEYDPDWVEGTRCSADCDLEGGGHVVWSESVLRTYEDMEFYTEVRETSIVAELPPGVDTWTRAELTLSSEHYFGYGVSDDGSWQGIWEGVLLPDWPADGSLSAEFRPWYGDAGGWGWRYVSADPVCPWRTEYQHGYDVEQTWEVEVAGHVVAVVDDDDPDCEATIDGAAAGVVACEGWAPPVPEEERPCGCDGRAAAFLPLLLLRRR